MLPVIPPIPDPIRNLYTGSTALSRRFLNNIRVFNNAFAFTSLGTDSNGCRNQPPAILGRGPKPFQAKSTLYHRIGSLLPSSGHVPSFAQIHFHHADQDSRTTINQRLDFIHNGHQHVHDNNTATTTKIRLPSLRDQENDKEIVKILEEFIGSTNHYALLYKTAAQRIRDSDGPIAKMTLISQQKTDPKIYNNPTVDEVAAILPGDGTQPYQDRDIMVQPLVGGFKRVSALSSCYWPLGYPLIFPRGENGFHIGLTRNPHPLELLPVQYADLPTLLDEHQDTDDADIESDLENDSHSDIESQEDSEHTAALDLEMEDEALDFESEFDHCSGVKTHDDDDDDGDDDDGGYYDENNDHHQKEHRVTMKDDFSYRLQLRHGDNSEFILRSKHLLQQWTVDMFCTMDMNNLNFFVKNQEKIRASVYNGNLMQNVA